MMEFPTKPYHLLSSRSCGFTLVEVLVATLIMVVSIVTVTAALRQFSINRAQLHRYEQLYTVTLSLRDRIMGETLTDNRQDKGVFNGLDYRYTCRLEQSVNNYVFGEDEAPSGNTGPFLIMLFKVSLEIEGKTFEFYKTQYKKRYETNNEEEF
ncbi:MAG: prepilin-type N-terminal cleavage/methylation domain-containing protein [Desulfuromonadales bacterium]